MDGYPSGEQVDIDGDGEIDTRRSWIYDRRGDLLFIESLQGARRGATIGYVYGEGRSLSAVTVDNESDGRLDRVTRYVYRDRLMLAEHHDANADGVSENSIWYEYDDLGRRTFTLNDVDNDGIVDRRYEHVWIGEQLVREGRDGAWITYEYDAVGRLRLAGSWENVGGLRSAWREFNYDDESRVVGWQSYESPRLLRASMSYVYDDVGRLVERLYSHHFYGGSRTAYTAECSPR